MSMAKDGGVKFYSFLPLLETRGGPNCRTSYAPINQKVALRRHVTFKFSTSKVDKAPLISGKISAMCSMRP